MRGVLALISLSVILLVAGCSGPPANENAANRNGRQRVPPSERKIYRLNARNAVLAFKSAGIPLANEIIYNAETDPEKRHTRPKMYIEKIAWVDNRVAPEGGIIEVFLKEEDMQQRKQALESEQAAAGAVEHMLTRENILVRLSKNLSSEQVGEYQNALAKAY